MTLVEDYLDLGHCIVMDNYYYSPKLYIELVKQKTDAVGTVRFNRRGLSINFRHIKLEKNEGIVRYYKKVLALKWLDKKYVNMLLTYHKDDITIIHKRGTQIEKPTCVHEYNVTRGGIDLTDQQIAPYCLPRKRMKKYYKKIFMILLNLAILNSYHLYKIQTQQTNDNMMTQLQFCIALARSLLKYNLHDHLPNQVVRRG
ncbi:unnamed protein product [Didymodactylos carnosus]|uniref:PiggyBac transposable element-derived protein domain-containing protein n=1 Tax=Didymodactylos carnosus TaxID=1234261 RepID=A0A815V4G2_9BILA|nr:unnamed protein product [Didymodactylos carnosus]CAF4389011.1 unnamed protein product [Didymodactylos carnosus]